MSVHTASPDVTILLPTYNEAQNIAPLLRALHHALDGTGIQYRILFVDDSSDMTPNIIERMQATYPNVSLLHRKPEDRTGLGTALVAGFSAASSKYILCMDADLQHSPLLVPKLVEKIIATDADIVVASRYIEGGSIDGLGSLYRKIVSRFARFVSWAIIPQTRKSTDPVSGFFIFKKSIINTVQFNGLRGFKILIDILGRTRDMKVEEIPCVFMYRENDKSKATLEQGISFFRHLVALKFQAWSRPTAKHVESALPRPQAPRSPKKVSWSFLVDAAIVMALVGVGWYLIGYYAAFNYLYTGYEDWIYHAFRVRSLEEYGIVSWDHVWSNGISYWRLYQYVAHYLILGVVTITGLPVTKVLMLSLVCIYIGLRVGLYLLLRHLGVQRLFALLAVIASYTIVQEWGSMQDYSIYIALALFPLYLLFWIRTFQDVKWVYVFAATTGLLWILHPVLAFNGGILLGFLMLFSRLKSDWGKMFRVCLAYLLGAAPFLVSYITADHFFTNPIFKSYTYLTLSVLDAYNGLSMLYWVLFGATWLLVIWRSHLIPAWTKVLLLYATTYLILIYLGQQNYLPNFLVQFQFSRGITAVAFALVIVFAVVSDRALGQIQGMSVRFMVTILLATGLVHAVDIASRYYVSPPVMEIDNPVALFFEDKAVPKGSVFVENVSEATYFSQKGIRFVTSYNEHMQPHPYSTRLRLLMHSRLGYTGISQAHVRNIENYATVLGIEYLFLPSASPLVRELTSGQDPMFQLVASLESDPLKDTLSVLQNVRPIHQAFVIDRSRISPELLNEELPLPTIHVASYKVWDEYIGKMAEIMRSDAIIPLPVEFIPTNKLRLSTPLALEAALAIPDPLVIVLQSYNTGWSALDTVGDTWTMSPTTLRFIALEKSGAYDMALLPIELTNNWPRWYWPVQSVGIISIVVFLVIALKRHGYIASFVRKLKNFYV